MNTNNNCNKEDYYSMDNSTDTIGKLEGWTRDTDDISDDELFKQPPPKEDCPICLLRYHYLYQGRHTTPAVEKLFAAAVIMHLCTIIWAIQ